MFTYLCVGPLTDITQEILLVKNPHPGPVIFKVKTTAPKQYCVRPNAGKIAGHGEVEVQGKKGKVEGNGIVWTYSPIYRNDV
jgi:hypothetical protein